MNRLLLHFFLGLWFSLVMVNGVALGGSTQASIEVTPTMTVDLIQSKIKTLNAREGTDEKVKNTVLKLYQAALDNLSSNSQLSSQIAQFNNAIHEAPEKTKVLQKEIEQTLSKLTKQKNEDFQNIPVEELGQRLIIEKGKISHLDDQLKKIEADLALQTNRENLIREETVVAQQTIDETQKKLALSPISTTDSKIEFEARQLFYKTLIDARTTELKLLETEAISQPARIGLLKAQLQLVDLQKNALLPTVATIENLVFERRRQEAKDMENVLNQTERELEDKHPTIQTRTHENVQYSRDLQAINAKIEQISDQKAQVETQGSDIENAFKSADKKINLAGLSPALGKILREQRRSLATKNDMTAQSKILQNEIALTSLDQFKVEDQLKKLLNLDEQLSQIMATEVELSRPFEQRMMIQAQLRVLLNSQKELLNKLALADTAYLRALGDLDFARQQMLTQATKFAAYLDERLLWVPSSEPFNKTELLSGTVHSLQWLLSPINWLNFAQDMPLILSHNVFFSLATLIFLAILLQCNRWIIKHLQVKQCDLQQWHPDHFAFTLRTIFFRTLLILPIPASSYLLGLGCINGSDVDFNQAIGAGLEKAAMSLLMLQFYFLFFCSEGIARRHFQWHKNTVALLHKHLYWVRFIIVPAVFLIHTTTASQYYEYGDTLGRLSLIVMELAIGFFMIKLAHPNHGLWERWLSEGKTHWLLNFRYLLYILVIIIPMIIMGFAAAGYYLSALELQEKLINTLRLFMLTVIAHELLFRWLSLINRQLATKNEQLSALGSYNTKTPQIDINKINAQTRKFMRVMLTFVVTLGFWVIWKNILPAFSFLDHMVLWQHKAIIDNQESYQPITLTNLLLAILYFFIAIVSVRNFSGVLELMIFRRWHVEAGSRYAVNQLAKYSFITTAFICIANEMGGSWAQVQWLVAALGVGLGFGLQEIFANLVSGIILLFERPIRVGDIVTISDVTGKVSRIQMRATTLLDWDQRELIVPNKTFITSQLVNWTLTDPTTRIVIPIGIAFGSDVAFAHELMLKTVKETPLILETPEPCVFFVGFGESALNFSIRAFVASPLNTWPVTHDLNIRLERVLRENEIKIPYPQREIYIKQENVHF